nr:type II/IV secretion system protein [uncultured Anaerotignum sp.]
MKYKRLGELLVSVGLVTEEQIQEALALQKTTKKRLGDQLVASGYITQKQLIEAMQMQLGIEFIDLSDYEIPAELARVIPKNIAKKFQVVPIRVSGDTLFLAMSDPMNFMAIEDAKTASRKKIVPMITYGDSIERAILNLYGNEGAMRAIEEMKREMGEEDVQITSAAFQTNAIDADVQSAPTIRLVNSVIERAVNLRASDIHIEPMQDILQVRMRIDGLMRSIMKIPKNLQNAIISRFKIMGGMDIAEHRIPLDGRSEVRVKEITIDLRISTLPTVYGEKVVVRLLDKSTQRLNKENIGLKGEDLEKYNALLAHHAGVVLIVGPTGSGKSSTMYTMIGELNREDVNLVTLEDPVEYNIEGVNQVQINEKAGMTFANGLRAILRQDPDIIAVGEIRDGETAEIAMRAALTGHLVLSTVHTNDAITTLDRLENIGVDEYLTVSALQGIISQRLVRRICPHCKEKYTPSKDELDFMGMENEAVEFYHGVGCPRCFNTGYLGRTAVFEILTMNRKLRKALMQKTDREEFLRLVMQGDFTSIFENGRRLVRNGETTVEEIRRCLNTEY